MKVLILSTYRDAGGAAIAASHLLRALQKSGAEAAMLCRRNTSFWCGKKPQSWTSIMERLVIWVMNGFSKKDLWATDINLFGQDITATEEYREADVVHLHWVNQGFIRLEDIKKFLKDGKKVVWTMHDAWNSMGAYHLKLQQEDTLLERWTSRRKAKLYEGKQIQFVTCSEWLRNEALATPLMNGQNVTVIPNSIDTSLFRPIENRETLRKSFGLPEVESLVLFVAQDVNNPNKGMQYLREIELLLREEDVSVVALGRDLPYIHSPQRMAELYSCVDAFVLPSLSENLPNTIMESMACGTPCVGFNVGGIPEMIDHCTNGYVARYKDSTDLLTGIRYVLANHDDLGREARGKVLRCYREEIVAERYMQLYSSR